jgi:hypothetical protein
MKTEEIWLPVMGFEGYYEVSNLGNIKRLKRIVNNARSTRTLEEKMLLPKKTNNKYGYTTVSLSKEGKSYGAHMIGRCVYEAFNNVKINATLTVAHKDGNKTNNKLDNLKILTRRNIKQVHKSNTGIVGVRKVKGSFHAYIKFGRKSILLHMSKDKNECRKIYQLAKAMIDEYDKLKTGILSNSRVNNKLIVKSLPIK